jgi:Tol biopolymer transport system component
LHFGLGDAESIFNVVVNFSDGQELSFDDLQINRTYLIDYDGKVVLIGQGGASSVTENNLNRHISIFPNPVIGNATVEYLLTNAGNVHLSVYDISGIEIMNLINGFTESGIHQVSLNGKELPYGTYILRYTLDNVIYSHKFIVAN